MEFNVIVRVRIMPSRIDVDLEKIKGRLTEIINEFGRLKRIETKPVAFGLNSLEAILLLDDSKGGIDRIESRVLGIDGVGKFDVLDISRI